MKNMLGLFMMLFVGLVGADEMDATNATEPAAAPAAIAQLKPTQGNSVTGTVRFLQQGGGVQVTATVSGLTPGQHGFHVHEKGDCSDPEGKSAGGHFNPAGQAHGAPGSAAHHAGDLGNLEADENGNATLEQHVHGLQLTGEQGLIGRGMIVHADADDLSTQPTGNAGARVACGVIEAAAP